MRVVYILTLILAISSLSLAFSIIDDCDRKFDALIQLRDFKPMVVQYTCSTIFQNDCPLEDLSQAQYILMELTNLLIDDVPILKVENHHEQIPLDSSYYNLPTDASTITCFYKQANEFPKCFRGVDANNILSNLLPEIYNYNASLFKNKEFDPKGRLVITLNSSSDPAWIEEVKAKFGDKADIIVKESPSYIVKIKMISGMEYKFPENISSAISLRLIESYISHEEILAGNVVNLKYGQKLNSVVPKDKAFFLHLYNGAEMFSAASIELVNFLSQVYDPDQVVFVRAFIPHHMPLVFKYALWEYRNSYARNFIVFFPHGYKERQDCSQKKNFKLLNRYGDFGEKDIVSELEQYGIEKPAVLDLQWNETNYEAMDVLERNRQDSILRIYLRTRYGTMLSLDQRAALRQVQKHFNNTSIQFIYKPTNILDDDEEVIIGQLLPNENVKIFVARFNGKIINHIAATKLNSTEIIQFVNASLEEVPNWLESRLEEINELYDFACQKLAQVWYKLFPTRE